MCVCVCLCVSNVSSIERPTVLLHRVNTNNGDKIKTKAEVTSTFHTGGNSPSVSVRLIEEC